MQIHVHLINCLKESSTNWQNSKVCWRRGTLLKTNYTLQFHRFYKNKKLCANLCSWSSFRFLQQHRKAKYLPINQKSWLYFRSSFLWLLYYKKSTKWADKLLLITSFCRYYRTTARITIATFFPLWSTFLLFAKDATRSS